MEDRNVENRVWNRVFAGPEESGEDLRALIYGAAELAMDYSRLLRNAQGKNRAALQQLYDRERVNGNALRGIQILRFGAAPKPRVTAGEMGDFRKTLERCYRRTRRAMTEYTARSAEPEYGAVFAVMADRERLNAAQIAEILGMSGER